MEDPYIPFFGGEINSGYDQPAANYFDPNQHNYGVSAGTQFPFIYGSTHPEVFPEEEDETAIPDIEDALGDFPDVAPGNIQPPDGFSRSMQRTHEFPGGGISSYMNPYMEQVTQREREAATEEFERVRNRTAAQEISAGSRGGYRSAMEDIYRGAAHEQVLADITGKGQQRAYESAQQQYERDRQSQMQFQRMNMEASQMNQQAFMRARELGDAAASREAQMRMEAGRANQEAYARAFEFGDTAIMKESEMKLSSLLDFERRSLQAQELEYGGWRDTVELQRGLAEASAGLGQTSEANYMRRMLELERAGVTQREMAQKVLDQQREDFMRQSLYPQQQLNWLMGLLGGVPVTPESTYVSQPATPGIASQLLGLGVGMGGLGSFLGGGG